MDMCYDMICGLKQFVFTGFSLTWININDNILTIPGFPLLLVEMIYFPGFPGLL